jgi:hypothetical protein
MTDIVQRLRQWANYPTLHGSYDLIKEAADTIEELQIALQRIADGEIPASSVDEFAERTLKDQG